MRSLLIIGASAAVLVLFLVRNEREAREAVRAEDEALEAISGLVHGPRGPPRSAGSYRFEWREDGELPPLLLGLPEADGVRLLAAEASGAVYAYELFGDDPPDVTPLRIRVARGAEAPLPAGWRQVR